MASVIRLVGWLDLEHGTIDFFRQKQIRQKPYQHSR
jgi:hypothetical protein